MTDASPIKSLAKIKSFIDDEAKSLHNVYKLNKPNEENWKEILETMRISFNMDYEEPPVCIEINQDGIKCTFGTLGNFSVFIGKAKSRKTFLIALFISAFLTSNSLIENIIVAKLLKNKNRIIFFDTEQSQYDVSRVVNRILTLSENKDPQNFEVFSLRALPPKERLFIIEQKIYNTEGLCIVVIDGIRDLISDINSPEEATMITSKLLKWTEDKNIHIMTVLHQNKGDNNARDM